MSEMEVESASAMVQSARRHGRRLLQSGQIVLEGTMPGEPFGGARRHPLRPLSSGAPTRALSHAMSLCRLRGGGGEDGAAQHDEAELRASGLNGGLLGPAWRGGLGRARGGEAVAQPVLAAEPIVSHPLFERLSERYARLSLDLDPSIGASAAELARRVVEGLTESASELEIDQLAAETAAYLTSHHPDYSKLAARVAVERLHAHTSDSFAETMEALANHRHPKRGTPAPLVTPEFAALARELAGELDQVLDYTLDYEYDYFGLRTLTRSYLLGTSAPGIPLERPQHMLMRVALAVHAPDLQAVLKAYDLMSRGMYTHATPTLFNAGCPRGQLCSCFLLTTRDDSVRCNPSGAGVSLPSAPAEMPITPPRVRLRLPAARRSRASSTPFRTARSSRALPVVSGSPSRTYAPPARTFGRLVARPAD